jgi:hypothetical protein
VKSKKATASRTQGNRLLVFCKAEPFKLWLARVGRERIDEISRAWSDMTTREYKNYKGLKKENLRDNMSISSSTSASLYEKRESSHELIPQRIVSL